MIPLIPYEILKHSFCHVQDDYVNSYPGFRVAKGWYSLSGWTRSEGEAQLILLHKEDLAYLPSAGPLDSETEDTIVVSPLLGNYFLYMKTFSP